ncbi:MAG: HAMP domain-containing sensor histidine kinase [Bellilinea sp.]
MISLRWRLTLWHLGLMIVSLVIFSIVSYEVLSISLREEIDRTLVERANHVADAIAVVPNRPIEGITADRTDEFRSPGVYLQITNASGKVVSHSYNLGTQELPLNLTNNGQLPNNLNPYTTISISGQSVRLFHQSLVRDGAIIGAVQVGQSFASLEATLSRLRMIYMGGIIIVIVLGFVGGWVLASMGLRPVVNVTRAASDIVRAEDLLARVKYSGPQDEIGQLAKTFNEMLDRLQSLFEGQRRFLAEAAHELRTPLAAMIGNIDLLARFHEDQERRAEAIAALQRTGKHVSRLLDDLLLLAQADAGWRLQLEPMWFDDLFMEVYETSRSSWGNNQVELIACEPSYLLGDPDRLRQVLLNLIDNAIKFSPPHSPVALALRCQNNRVLVQISDQGSGISTQSMERLFQPFSRGNAPSTLPGAGLGLVIARWIVREHKGDLRIESQVGKGTTATIDLPEQIAPEGYWALR